MAGRRAIVAAVVAAAVSGALLKTLGGLLSGSVALLVDGLTCIGNLAALAGSLAFERYRWVPPDADHHYGHHRLALGGTIVVLVVYSFIAGFSLHEVLVHVGDSVSPRAPLYAAAGMALYIPAIVLAGRIGGPLRAYAAFTWSEVLEGAVSLAASAGGALVSYVVDRVGAAAILAFIVYEIIDTSRDLVVKMSDVAPEGLGEVIRREVESRLGVKVEQVRVRVVDDGVAYGDMVVKVPSTLTVRQAHAIATLAERLALNHGVRMVVHVEPDEGGRDGVRR